MGSTGNVLFSQNIDFSANPERTEGTYTKYASLDDKIDGLFYYTSYIKFGIEEQCSTQK